MNPDPRPVFGNEAIDAHDGAFAAFDRTLVPVGRLLNLTLDEALRDGLHHAAHGLDPGQVLPGSLLEGVSEGLHRKGARQRIGHLGQAALVGDHLLGLQRQPGSFLGGQRQGFVPRIGVQ